ncbi:hypothetical protein Lesp02_67260 [Lentzea sp. NBRC 105346]|uniref:hypothetical protein n=1 Tax=Lentzea sp. NBRC 105346 TaxID=3032205 RepID=UPI0024A472F1|nr:hypothetical protein [Lentzea sp. NBRC 105346]GLZ34539.1 hypothetical protein Lesp02_67260 [Lentzea sp. NBRC 105346]
MKKRLILLAFGIIAALFATAMPASASSAGLSGSLRKGQWVHYGTQRTISVSGTHIFVKKTDGPELDVKWRRCAGGAEGSPVRLQNADPTPRIRIGSNFRSGTVFCLSAKSHGNNTTDTWNGTVWWNVTS